MASSDKQVTLVGVTVMRMDLIVALPLTYAVRPRAEKKTERHVGTLR